MWFEGTPISVPGAELGDTPDVAVFMRVIELDLR
jgi:hypothetical protein